jgi:integrase
MEAVSQSYHLNCRKGVWHYRRRVPTALVQSLGKRFIQFPLGTANLKEAKKRSAAEDLKWSLQFEAAEKALEETAGSKPEGASAPQGYPLSKREVLRLVQDYVEQTDAHSGRRLAADPPESEEQKAEIIADTEYSRQILRNLDDIRADQMVHGVGEKILQGAGASIDDVQVPFAAFAELVRRGLLELDQRQLARLNDHRHTFFDQLFNPARVPDVTFAELCDQYARLVEEEAEANCTSRKWVTKQHANLALLREIVGDATPVHEIDYDACLRVRSLLARIPANRIKLYRNMPLDEAIARGAAREKPLLTSVTQEVYLGTLRSLLDVAAKKRLITVNPAEGMKPVRRDAVAPGSKRRPFTLEQIRQFFESGFYRECARHRPPYRSDKEGWRFWLPLMCLFMGMRPNEACQMGTEDVKRTAQGTWYLDVIAASEEEEGGEERGKTLKTTASRRRIPVHPELIAIGFLQFVEERRRSGLGRLFPDLKPDGYGNVASYALKRFRETFLPQAITVQARQSFYSFRPCDT